MVVLLQIVEPVFGFERYGRVHDNGGVRLRVQNGEKGTENHRLKAMGRRQTLERALLFYGGGEGRARHTRRQRRPNTTRTIRNSCWFFFFFSRSVPHERKRKKARDGRVNSVGPRAGLMGFRRRIARTAVEKKNGARVTDARTYTDTMNCVMAGNSCARCADTVAAAAQPKRPRIHTPRTRPPCFFRLFSRAAVARVGFSIGNPSAGHINRSPPVKSAGNTVKSPFAAGYCSCPVAVPLRTPACGSAALRLGRATVASARGRPCAARQTSHGTTDLPAVKNAITVMPVSGGIVTFTRLRSVVWGGRGK